MEIINVDKIFEIVLSLYVLIGIIILFMPVFRAVYIVPVFRIVHLNGLINKNDFEKFIETVDKYIKKAKSVKRKNLFRFEKLNAMIRLRKWNGIEEVLNSIEMDFSNYSVNTICNIILDLYILDRIKEGRILLTKIQEQINQQNHEVKQNIRIRLCMAIDDYFNDNILRSQRELQELLHTEIKKYKGNSYQKICMANTYFYLGLISKQENEISKSKEYFESTIAVVYPQECVIVNKASKIIDEISEE